MTLQELVQRVIPWREPEPEQVPPTSDEPPEREPLDPSVIPLMLIESSARLHGNSELKGLTRLVKLTFLFEQERLDNYDYETPDVPTYNYYSNDYGPFSNYLYEDLVTLTEHEVLERRVTTNRSNCSIFYYRLTDTGSDFIDDRFNASSIDREELQPVIDEFTEFIGDHPIDSLLRYTFVNYPEYTHRVSNELSV